MIALENFIYSIKLPLPQTDQKKCALETEDYVACEPIMLGLGDLCRQEYITSAADEAEWESKCKDEEDQDYCLVSLPKKCYTSQRPIDFIYERKTDAYVI